MPSYRAEFSDASGCLCGSQAFLASDDEEAVVLADVLKEVCSDQVSGYKLWRGGQLVLRDRPGIETVRTVIERRQANIVALAEAIRASNSSIAVSRRLLMLTALVASHPTDAAFAEPRDTRRQVGPLSLDLIERTATRDGRRIELLPREFKLLDYLMCRPDRLVTQTMLFRDVWNYRHFPENSSLIRVQFGHLRHKVDSPGDWCMLRSIRSAGVMLVSRPTSAGLSGSAPGERGASLLLHGG